MVKMTQKISKELIQRRFNELKGMPITQIEQLIGRMVLNYYKVVWMKYKIKDNHLMIYYENGELKEDATDNQNECEYCKHNPKDCSANSPEETKKYGGQFCDSMKCIFEEV